MERAAEFSESLARRLGELVEKFSQAEVARAGDMPESSVYHYLRGRRMPVEFCVRLCRGLGVNLNWFLTGAGKPDATEGALQAGRMAEDLDGLVRVMIALEREVGQRAGRDLAVGRFRELSSILDQLQATRARVRDSIRPVTERLLEELKDALRKMNLTRAADIETALKYLVQFDLPEELRAEVEMGMAVVAQLEFRLEDSLRLREGRFWRYLASGERNPLRLQEMASQLIAALSSTGQNAEAVALADGMLAATRDATGDRAPHHRLRVMRAIALTEVGRVKEALAEMVDALPRLERQYQVEQLGKLQRALMLGGLLDVRDALSMAPGDWSPLRAFDLLRFAVWSEDAEVLSRSLARLQSYPQYFSDKEPRLPLFARCLLDALEGKPRKALKDWRGAMEATEPRRLGVSQYLREAELCNLSGDRRTAQRLLRRLIETVNEGGLKLHPSVMEQGELMREIERLNISLPKRGVAGLHPESWQRRRVEEGYAFFRDWGVDSAS